jgi:hypothetical protein
MRGRVYKIPCQLQHTFRRLSQVRRPVLRPEQLSIPVD